MNMSVSDVCMYHESLYGEYGGEFLYQLLLDYCEDRGQSLQQLILSQHSSFAASYLDQYVFAMDQTSTGQQ